MHIGQFSLPSRVVLAPMAGVTDATFRAICTSLGAGLAVSEMISADTSLYASDKTLNRLQRLDEAQGGPHAVQIVGADPVKIAEAAVFNVKSGADIIDINMGCPAKKVCKKLAGSALLADPGLVRKILRSTVKAVEVPVTLKIRTGTDRQNRNGVEIARMAEREGIQAIAVHGRTRADKYNGRAEYDTIREIKQSVSIPVLANGDIRSARDAQKVLDYTGADAVMIGRAAQGNPWIFRQVSEYLQTGELIKPPTRTAIYKVLLRHLHGLYKLHGEYRGVRVARKHIAWYCRDSIGVAEFRQAINTAETIAGQLDLVERFFADFSEQKNDVLHPRIDAA
ncbi:MAG: tRNA dihydrouridine synthase DusB [Gammaproteobacteria bacterium]|nr:tRNA dihydrouridine synthase DusB [Gammaproteobacteria bacterium]